MVTYGQRNLKPDADISTFVTVKGFVVSSCGKSRVLDQLWVLCRATTPMILRREGGNYHLIGSAMRFRQEEGACCFMTLDWTEMVDMTQAKWKRISIV